MRRKEFDLVDSKVIAAVLRAFEDPDFNLESWIFSYARGLYAQQQAEILEEELQILLYGDPDAPEPVGLLRVLRGSQEEGGWRFPEVVES